MTANWGLFVFHWLYPHHSLPLLAVEKFLSQVSWHRLSVLLVAFDFFQTKLNKYFLMFFSHCVCCHFLCLFFDLWLMWLRRELYVQYLRIWQKLRDLTPIPAFISLWRCETRVDTMTVFNIILYYKYAENIYLHYNIGSYCCTSHFINNLSSLI